jgi:aldose 1-epimerase
MTKTSTGKRVGLWVSEGYPIIEIYAGDTLALEKRRKGLGAEPMTCTPNAFASGDGLTRLERGRSDYVLCRALLT